MPSPETVTLRLYSWFAISTAVFALSETFLRIENAFTASLAWGGFLLGLGLGHTVILLHGGRPAGFRLWWIGHSATAVVTGVLTLWFASSDQPALVSWSVTVWALLSGVTTLAHAMRGNSGTIRTDWLVVGGVTSLLALVTLVVPAGVVATMGFAGVWGSIVAVFLGIGAVNLRMVLRQDKGA